MNVFQKLAYTYHEACEISGITSTFLQKAIRAGKGPKFRRAGGRVIILHKDLDKWLQSLPVNAPNTPED